VTRHSRSLGQRDGRCDRGGRIRAAVRNAVPEMTTQSAGDPRRSNSSESTESRPKTRGNKLTYPPPEIRTSSPRPDLFLFSGCTRVQGAAAGFRVRLMLAVRATAPWRRRAAVAPAARRSHAEVSSRRSVAPARAAPTEPSKKTEPQTCANLTASTSSGAHHVDNLTPRHPIARQLEKVCYPNPRTVRSLSSCLTFAIPYLVKSRLQDTRCSV
jgi:hypothetical protein